MPIKFKCLVNFSSANKRTTGARRAPLGDLLRNFCISSDANAAHSTCLIFFRTSQFIYRSLKMLVKERAIDNLHIVAAKESLQFVSANFVSLKIIYNMQC